MKCPICLTEVRAIDTFDTEYFGDSYYDNVTGTCPTCGKTWRWTEVYKFAHVIDVQEVISDDHP